jgi:hypothetical protein
MLEVSYQRDDQVALSGAAEALGDAMIAGDPAAIREAEQQIQGARLTVDFATCQGRGRAWRGMFRTFRCKLDMSSEFNVKTVFATLHVVGSTSTRRVLRASYAAEAARFAATVATMPGSSPVIVTIGTLASTEAM